MKCLTQDCLSECNENYKYCSDCYARWKSKQGTGQSVPVTGQGPVQWHADPVADQLMKLNANLGKLVIELRLVGFHLQELKGGEKKFMHRTKDDMGDDDES